jgi:hypothetical protein
VAVSAQSQNAEAAYEWVKFLTSSKEAVEIRIAAGWELPAATDEAPLEGYLAQPIPESREVVFEALDSAVVPPVIGNWNQLTDAVGKELDEAKLGRKHRCTGIDEGNLIDEAHSGRSRSDDHLGDALGTRATQAVLELGTTTAVLSDRMGRAP